MSYLFGLIVIVAGVLGVGQLLAGDWSDGITLLGIAALFAVGAIAVGVDSNGSYWDEPQ